MHVFLTNRYHRCMCGAMLSLSISVLDPRLSQIDLDLKINKCTSSRTEVMALNKIFKRKGGEEDGKTLQSTLEDICDHQLFNFKLCVWKGNFLYGTTNVDKLPGHTNGAHIFRTMSQRAQHLSRLERALLRLCVLIRGPP